MSTVTLDGPQAVPPTRRRVGRTSRTAADLCLRAAKLILDHGHHVTDFGNDQLGYSLHGGIYRAAGFLDRSGTLRQPTRCDTCQRNSRLGDTSEWETCTTRGCEMPLWWQCVRAFRYLAATLNTSPGFPVNLAGLKDLPATPGLDYMAVVDGNLHLRGQGRLDNWLSYELHLTYRRTSPADAVHDVGPRAYTVLVKAWSAASALTRARGRTRR